MGIIRLSIIFSYDLKKKNAICFKKEPQSPQIFPSSQNPPPLTHTPMLYNSAFNYIHLVPYCFSLSSCTKTDLKLPEGKNSAF